MQHGLRRDFHLLAAREELSQKSSTRARGCADRCALSATKDRAKQSTQRRSAAEKLRSPLVLAETLVVGLLQLGGEDAMGLSTEVYTVEIEIHVGGPCA